MHVIPGSSRGLKVLALALAVTNLILWYTVPWLRNALDPRLTSPFRPVLVNGVQELLVYFDPWLAGGVFPVMYTLGFVAMAFLFQPDPDPVRPSFGCAAVAKLLLSFEAVWLFLTALPILCRGPDWNLYWPWEPWTPKFELTYRPNFSNIFWWTLTGQNPVYQPWVLREAPGFLLVAGYLSLGLLVARILARGAGRFATLCCFVLLTLLALAPLVFRKIVHAADDFRLELSVWLGAICFIVVASYLFFRLLRQLQPSGVMFPMALWRSVLLVFLVQVAALVPVKVLLYWAFDLKYVINLPEFDWNL